MRRPSTGVPPIRCERGPIVGSTGNRSQRNVIGTHSGSYGVYRALAVAAGDADRAATRADLTNTIAHRSVGPYAQWGDAEQDRVDRPLGARRCSRRFADDIAQGYDIRPTIAVTKAHIDLPEITQAIAFQAPGRRRRSAARRRLGRGDQGRDRAGVVAAGRGQALQLSARPTCGARCSRKPAACTPSW